MEHDRQTYRDISVDFLCWTSICSAAKLLVVRIIKPKRLGSRDSVLVSLDNAAALTLIK
jgi:hypothetical protein